MTFFFGGDEGRRDDDDDDDEFFGWGSIEVNNSSICEPSWPSKTEPRRLKIDVEMALNFDQFLKASWNAIFSAQEAPRRASAADRRSGGSQPEATGGGFRRGKTRTSEKKDLEGGSGRIRRPGILIPHADPVGRRIEAPLGGVPPPKFWE